MNKKEQAHLDKKLAHWAATDTSHKANVKRLEELHKHDLDWFDLAKYQAMVAKFK